MTLIGSTRRRSTFTVLDHGVSSGSNFILSIVLARMLSVDAYGAFSVCFAIYTVVLGLSRALSTDPLLVLHGPDDAEGVRSCRGAIGLNAAIGVAVGLVIVAVAAFVGGTFGPIALALGLCLPALLLQDAVRYSLIAQRRPDRATAVDALWLGAMAILAVVVVVGEADLSAWVTIAIWAGGAVLSVLVAQRWRAARPSMALARPWFVSSRKLGWRFATEFVMIGGAPQAVLLIVSFTSLAAAGALRGGWVLFGPPAILLAGLVSVALAEGSREWGSDPRRARLFLGLLLSLLVVADVMWGTLAWLLPESIGTALLGDTWPGAHQLVPALTALAVATAAMGLGMAGMRSSGRAERTMRITVPTMLAVLAAGAVGALAGQAQGAVWAMVIPTALGAAILWWALVGSESSEGRVER